MGKYYSDSGGDDDGDLPSSPAGLFSLSSRDD